MQRHEFSGTGRQKPIFLCPKTRATRFWVEGDVVDGCVQFSYDPPQVKGYKRQWDVYDGGLAGHFAEHSPTAIRLNLTQATGPVFLCLEEEGVHTHERNGA